MVYKNRGEVMLKIAICDDNLQQLDCVKAAVESYFSTNIEWEIQIETHKNSLLF